MKKELNIDSSHSYLERAKKISSKILSYVLSVGIFVSAYSGAFKIKANAENTERPQNTETNTNTEDIIIDIPEELAGSLLTFIGKTVGPITAKDLEQLKFLNLVINTKTTNLSFLKYCKNLKSVNFAITDISVSNLDFIFLLPHMPSLTKITILNYTSYDITPEQLEHLISICPLQDLDLGTTNITPGCEESINKLEKLTFDSNHTCDIDFTKITALKELNISRIPPYTLAVFLNQEDYNHLINNNVNVVFENSEKKQEYLNVLIEIDKIIEMINLDENASDTRKQNLILTYVLEKLTYDEKMANLLQTDQNRDDYRNSFYEPGILYGALALDSQICGNYAALIEAIMDRISPPEASTIISNNIHAWNLIVIDKEAYYVDATWLDGEIKYIEEITNDNGSIIIKKVPLTALEALQEGDGSIEKFNWYRATTNPDELKKLDSSTAHDVINYPFYMPRGKSATPNEANNNSPTARPEIENTEVPKLEGYQKEEENDNTGKQYTLTIGNKTYIFAGASGLVALLTAAGILISVKKKRERKRRQQQQQLESESIYSYH